MKLSEIVASIAELKQTLASFVGDKAKATTEAISGFTSSLAALESGAVAALGQAGTELATAKTTIGTLTANLEKAQGEVNATGGALKSACSALKLDIKEGATSADMVAALQGGVSATLAKLNIDASKIPGAKASTAPGGDVKTKTREQYQAMNPREVQAFFQAGGRLVD